MAISKRIPLPNGVQLNHHIIASLSIIVGKTVLIEVQSYTSAAKRAEEKKALEEGEPIDVYIEASYYEMPYSEGVNVTSAYEYLKGLEEFSSSKDS